MKLDVVEGNNGGSAWYGEGLRFTCTQCGNCCTGPPGYIWISSEEIVRLAEFLKLTPGQTVERYCRKVDGRFSLKERRTPQNQYDCIFLKEQEDSCGESSTLGLNRKSCSVYPVPGPLQCRTWPFWPENLSSQQRWKSAGKRCHGIDNGNRHFTPTQIAAIRDAADWPANPPTSGSGKPD